MYDEFNDDDHSMFIGRNRIELSYLQRDGGGCPA